ncbi:hypothetical protein BZJ20_01255 [Salinivibrio proteolyticus]|nr:hypothetical protein BZJ20_01255 [Salinivibrio proteolyticus]
MADEAEALRLPMVPLKTAVIAKGIFKLPLRVLQGFLDSIFGLMGVPLKSAKSVLMVPMIQKPAIKCSGEKASNRPFHRAAIRGTERMANS